MRQYRTYIRDEVTRLDEAKITSFIDGLCAICPRNRNLIIVYTGDGSSDIAKYAFRSPLNTDFGLLLGEFHFRWLKFNLQDIDT